MDPAVLKAHLALAERHVADGEKIIEKQFRLIAELEAKGFNTESIGSLAQRV